MLSHWRDEVSVAAISLLTWKLGAGAETTGPGARQLLLEAVPEGL